MPRAPDNRIPYNVPWGAQGHPSPARTSASGTPRAGGAPQPRSQGYEAEVQAPVQRALEILEAPSQSRPEGRRLAKRLAGAVVVIVLALLTALSARFIHQYNIEAARPVITNLYFPAYLPAQDATVPGRIYFKDRDRDVSYAKFEPIVGRFGSFEAAPPKWTGRATGFLDFHVYIYCKNQREGGFRVTLFDRGGHSRSLVIGFRCG